MTEYKGIEGHSDLIKDMHSKAVINTNRSAYLLLCKENKILLHKKMSLRDATREINILKSEMHEIKSLTCKIGRKRWQIEM